MIFETFETSPLSADVLAAQNALQWDFPSRAASLPSATFFDPTFRDTLAIFLAQASSETIEKFATHIHKAGGNVPEIRQPADPALISQILLPMIEALGKPMQVPGLRKQIRDDVNLDASEGALPWRRSPFWLTLRVTIQHHLGLALGDEAGRAYYKFLICIVLAQLMADCAEGLTPEKTVWARSKLCRRLAKLEMDRAGTTPGGRAVYKQLFGSTTSFFRDTIQAVTLHLETAWDQYKRDITPTIPKLPLRAGPADFRLPLSNSAKYLQNAVKLASQKRSQAEAIAKPTGRSVDDQFQRFADQYYDLAKLEIDIEKGKNATPSSGEYSQLAQGIIRLASMPKGAFDAGPEQASASILAIFDMWVRMDKYATKECPLLLDYHPVFHPELLDVLQLPTAKNMERLKGIQIYLRERCSRCKFSTRTILSKSDKECFASRYVAGSTALQDLRNTIQTISTQQREQIEENWENARDKYSLLTTKILSLPCSCQSGRGACSRCQSFKERDKLKVTVHEAFLPPERHLSSMVYLSLGHPATWLSIEMQRGSSLTSLPTQVGRNPPPPKFAYKTFGHSSSGFRSKPAFLRFPHQSSRSPTHTTSLRR